MSEIVRFPDRCRWCPDRHPSEHCPRVAAFQFFPDGALMRVEFYAEPVLEFEFDEGA